MAADAVATKGQTEASTLVEREKIRAAYGTWTQYVDGFPFAGGLALIMSGRWPEIGDTPRIVALCWLTATLAWAIGSSLAFRWYRTSSPAMLVRISRALLCTVWALHAAIWGAAVWVFWQQGNAVNQAILNTITLAVFRCV